MNMSEEAVGSMEVRARRMGWVSDDEFKGSPEKWVDAETFVRRAEEEMPILRGTLRQMEGKMSSQETTISELRQKIESMRSDFAEFSEFAKGAEARSYERALADLKGQQQKAFNDQDEDAFKETTAKIDEHLRRHPAVEAEKRKKVQEQQSSQQPLEGYNAETEQRWAEENPWYFKVPKMAIYARQVDAWLAQTQPKQTYQERMKAISDNVRDEFPDYFGNARRERAASVEGGSPSLSKSSGKRTYADLPDWAKVQCDKFAGTDGKGKGGSIPGFTREQYIQDFQWESVR